MKKMWNQVMAREAREDFNMPATLTVMLLLLFFIGASFYVILSGYMGAS